MNADTLCVSGGNQTRYPDRLPGVTMDLITKRILMQGFLNGEHIEEHFAAFEGDVGEWLKTGQLHAREDVLDGLEQAPEALRRVLNGRNFGKLLVRVSIVERGAISAPAWCRLTRSIAGNPAFFDRQLIRTFDRVKENDDEHPALQQRARAR